MSIHDEVLEIEDDLEALGLTEEELNAVKPEEEDTEDTDEPDNEVAEEDEEEGPEASAEEAPVEEAVERTEVAFAPKFVAESTEGFDDKLGDLEVGYTKVSDELAAKYEEGKLSFSEYRREDRSMQAEYDSLKRELTSAQLKEEIAAEHSEQSANQKWEMEQQMFFQDNEVYKTDPILRGALGAQLDALYKDPDNAGKTGLQFLREAGKSIDERFNRTAVTESTQELDKAKDAQRKKGAKGVEAPVTLGQVPAAEANSDDGEFAHIDKLSGLDYEKAISRMSEDQKDRFMAA